MITLLYITRPYRDWVARLSFASAYPALVLMTATLLLGPLNLLRSRRNPVSTDLRRDIGIWAGALALLHTAVGQNVHLRGRPWLYYVYEHPGRHTIPLRHDLFGFSNFAGALSSLLVIALLATSNDLSLRALGTPRWKSLQRWNYAAFALAAAHTVGYQANAKGNAPFVVAAAACITLTLIFQILGYRSRRATLSAG